MTVYHVEVEKSYRNLETEQWQIKVTMKEIIDLANNLNIKYSLGEKTLPGFMNADHNSSMEFDQSFTTNQKM